MPIRAALWIVLLAGVLGFGLSRLWPKREEPGRAGVVALTASGRGPAFHLGLSDEEAARLVQECLAELTTARPEALGIARDDLALLADREATLDAILEAFEKRGHATDHEAAGFADMAARIKSPRLVPMVARLLKHDSLLVRQTAAQAARVQRDQSLTEILLTMYRRLEAEHPGQGGHTRLLIMEAAYLCGGPALAVILDQGLADSRSDVRTQAARLIAGADLRALAPGLRAALEKATEPTERTELASSLFHLGEPSFLDETVKYLSDPSPVVVIGAIQAIVNAAKIEQLATLARFEGESGVDLKPHFAWARARLQDRERLEQAARVAEHSGGSLKDRLAALRVLGSGVPIVAWSEIVRFAGLAVPEGAAALALGISETDEVPPREVFRALATSPDISDGTSLQVISKRMGDEGVGYITELWDEGTRPEFQPEYLGWLGEIRTPSARAALLSRRRLDPVRVDQLVRIYDLEERKR